MSITANNIVIGFSAIIVKHIAINRLVVIHRQMF